MKKTFVSRRELYRFCSDLGLMLSWGIPLRKTLIELEKETDNKFLKHISILISEKIIQGYGFEEVLKKYPGVFRPALIKWIKVGEKFGILDKALLEIAGLLKFDYLLVKENSPVTPKDSEEKNLLWKFFLKSITLLFSNI